MYPIYSRRLSTWTTNFRDNITKTETAPNRECDAPHYWMKESAARVRPWPLVRVVFLGRGIFWYRRRRVDEAKRYHEDMTKDEEAEVDEILEMAYARWSRLSVRTWSRFAHKLNAWKFIDWPFRSIPPASVIHYLTEGWSRKFLNFVNFCQFCRFPFSQPIGMGPLQLFRQIISFAISPLLWAFLRVFSIGSGMVYCYSIWSLVYSYVPRSFKEY